MSYSSLVKRPCVGRGGRAILAPCMGARRAPRIAGARMCALKSTTANRGGTAVPIYITISDVINDIMLNNSLQNL